MHSFWHLKLFYLDIATLILLLGYRITLVSDELSQILWSRVHPFLKDIVIDGDPHDHNVHGVPSLLKGRWRPIGLNNVRKFRFIMSLHTISLYSIGACHCFRIRHAMAGTRGFSFFIIRLVTYLPIAIPYRDR